jgi:hypothetical protein
VTTSYGALNLGFGAFPSAGVGEGLAAAILRNVDPAGQGTGGSAASAPSSRASDARGIVTPSTHQSPARRFTGYQHGYYVGNSAMDRVYRPPWVTRTAGRPPKASGPAALPSFPAIPAFVDVLPPAGPKVPFTGNLMKYLSSEPARQEVHDLLVCMAPADRAGLRRVNLREEGKRQRRIGSSGHWVPFDRLSSWSGKVENRLRMLGVKLSAYELQNAETFVDIEGQLSEDEVEDLHLRDEVCRLWQADREDKIQARSKAMVKLWKIQENGVKAATREIYLSEVIVRKFRNLLCSCFMQRSVK